MNLSIQHLQIYLLQIHRVRYRFLRSALIVILLCVGGELLSSEIAEKTDLTRPRTGQQWLDAYWPRYLSLRSSWVEIERDPKKFQDFWTHLTPVEMLMRDFCLYKDGERLNEYHIGEKTGHGGNFAGRQRLVAAYQAWEKNVGWPMMQRWRHGTLTSDETAYAPLLQVAYVYLGGFTLPQRLAAGAPATADEQECIRYVNEKTNTALGVQVRAFNEQVLSAGDIDDLRILSLRRLLANQSGISLIPYTMDDYSLVKYPKEFLDRTFQCHRFLTFEAALKSPRFSDEWPNHPFLIFQPEAVTQSLLPVPFHAPRDRETRAIAFEHDTLKWTDADFIDLKSFRGKKPVLLWTLGWSPKDDDAYLYFTYVERLQQAYGDTVAIFMVASTAATGEARFQGKSFIGNPIDYTRIGTVGFEVPDAPVLCEDMARDVKMHQMAWPWLTTACIVDSPGADLFADPIYGGRHPILIDIDGVVAMDFTHPGLNAPGPGVGGMEQNAGVMSAWVEREIRLILANHGRSVRQHKVDFLESMNAVIGGFGGSNTVGRLESIDLKAGIMKTQALHGNVPWGSTPPPPLVHIDGNPQSPSRTRFFDLAGETTPESFHPGDWVNLIFDRNHPDDRVVMVMISNEFERTIRHCPELRDADPDKEVATVAKLLPQVDKYVFAAVSPVFSYNTLFIPATVAAVDPGSRTMTLKRLRMKTEDMRGLQWVRQAGDRCHLFEPVVRQNYKDLEQVLADYDTSPIVTLYIPPGGFLFRNGIFQPHFDQIVAGDHVSYVYTQERPDSQGRTAARDVYVSSAIE